MSLSLKKEWFLEFFFRKKLGFKLFYGITPTAAMETLVGLPPLQLVVEKSPSRLHTDYTAPTILKNQTGDILLFSR
jgi:hypothetical protein